jgi:hypothetical protein
MSIDNPIHGFCHPERREGPMHSAGTNKLHSSFAANCTAQHDN